MEVPVEAAVYGYQVANLRVVRAQVLVHQLLGELLRAPEVAEEREDNRRVGDRRRVEAAEAVVVVPRKRGLKRPLAVEAALRRVVVGDGPKVA